jgi:hypothetical protein
MRAGWFVRCPGCARFRAVTNCVDGIRSCVLQVRELEEASAAAAAKTEELTASLEASEAALSEARDLAAQQASRLSHLESEFEALQVRCCPCCACCRPFQDLSQPWLHAAPCMKG